MSFDTTHIIAHSHCGNVIPPGTETEDGKRPKHRKVPLMRKTCACGRDNWEGCDHPWTPTDNGAAVVVKGHTRVYWAHKASIAAFGDSEIPVDGRVLNYAADSAVEENHFAATAASDLCRHHSREVGTDLP